MGQHFYKKSFCALCLQIQLSRHSYIGRIIITEYVSIKYTMQCAISVFIAKSCQNVSEWAEQENSS